MKAWKMQEQVAREGCVSVGRARHAEDSLDTRVYMYTEWAVARSKRRRWWRSCFDRSSTGKLGLLDIKDSIWEGCNSPLNIHN